MRLPALMALERASVAKDDRARNLRQEQFAEVASASNLLRSTFRQEMQQVILDSEGRTKASVRPAEGHAMSSKVDERHRRLILDVCLMVESDAEYPHTVDTLAEYSGLSKYHFQRVFSKVVGQSPMAYLRRLRLERAAYALKHSDWPVIDVALDAGFESHAGFTHAFTKLYGCSPSEFRSNHLVRPYLRLAPRSQTPADPAALAACPLTVRIERLPTWRVALKRFVGPTEKMPAVWQEMKAWCKRRGLLNGETIFLGLHHDDWKPEDPTQYRYDAAVVVDAAFEPDEEANMTFLSGGETAIVNFSGSLNQMDNAWRTFSYEWLPASGYQPRAYCVFDIYDSELICANTLMQVMKTLTGIKAQLCIPVSRTAVSPAMVE